MVRHGSTEYNLLDRYQGRLDIPLSPYGMGQIKRLVRELRAIDVEHVISSPLLRALQSAEIIAASLHCGLSVMPEFAERCMGVFEGLSREEARRRFPSLYCRERMHVFDWAPPDGETILEVARRVYDGLRILPNDSSPTIIVTHGTVAKVMHWLFGKVDDEDFFHYSLANGAPNTYNLSQLQVF